MDRVSQAVIELIGNEVCGCKRSLPERDEFTNDFAIELYNKAQAHDIAHIVGLAVVNNNLAQGVPSAGVFRDKIYSTCFRYENMEYVIESVSRVLEDIGVPYIPLKGAVLKKLYPQPWMRTGCDIDILVSEKNLEKAANAIADTLGYTVKGKGKHDISILSTHGIYVELHFSLLEEDASPEMAKVLSKAWDHAKPVGDGFRYELDDAMFYFYHIAHMAKHFIKGGCGIRPFLDLWLMEKSKNYDTQETKALLKKGKLTDFAAAARKLSVVWFSGEEHSKVTLLMQDFIADGGNFGSKETIMLSAQQKAGGRIKHILSRIFIPYDDLKGQYPIIKKYRFLTPLCEICRIFTLLFGKRKKFRKDYIERLTGVSDEHLDKIDYLFEKVGFK